MMRAIGISIAVLLTLQTHIKAQIVQLPSFHSFSYSGTVEVPDSGSLSLGGNRSSASHRSQQGGLFPGPLTRRDMHAAGQAAVTASIIDHQEIDRQILGLRPDQMVAQHQRIEAQRNRDRQGIREVDRTAEGKALVRHARSLYQQGQLSAAQDCYKLAVSLLEPTLRDLAIAEMRRLGLR